MSPDATSLIQQLQLSPHPEGGWYRETWRAAPGPDGRSAGTAILFLLEAGQRSHWHRVDASELWIYQGGSPLALRTAEGAQVQTLRLGLDLAAGEQPQGLVLPHRWQAAEADRGWCLVSCIVVPGFSFDGFEMAPPGWAPG
jgi:uncharacterized protein